MTITYNLTQDAFSFCDENAVLAPENVRIRFTSSEYRLGTLVVKAEREGEETKTVKTHGEDVDISALCQKAGKVNIEAELWINARKAKKWTCAPLSVIEADGEITVIPALVNMQNTVSTLTERVEELERENALIREALAEINNIMKG